MKPLKMTLTLAMKMLTLSLLMSLTEVPITTCHWELPVNFQFVTEPSFPDGIDLILRLATSFQLSARVKITVVPENPFG